MNSELAENYLIECLDNQLEIGQDVYEKYRGSYIGIISHISSKFTYIRVENNIRYKNIDYNKNDIITLSKEEFEVYFITND